VPLAPGILEESGFSEGLKHLLRDPFVAQEVTPLNRELWWDWLLSTGLWGAIQLRQG